MAAVSSLSTSRLPSASTYPDSCSKLACAAQVSSHGTTSAQIGLAMRGGPSRAIRPRSRTYSRSGAWYRVSSLPLGSGSIRHHGDRHEHDHRARHRGGQDPAQQREPCGEGDQDDARDDDQRGEHRRAALGKRRHADRDGGAGGAGEDHVARSDPADAQGLKDGGYAAAQDRGEHPPQQGLFGPAGPEHDRRQQHHGTDAHNDELQAEAQDEGAGRRLVGLVANGGRGVGFHFASLAGGGIPGQRSTVFPAIPA